MKDPTFFNLYISLAFSLDMIPVANGDVCTPPSPLEWKFSQVFGERTAGEEVQEGNVLVLDWIGWMGLLFLRFTGAIEVGF